jgi:hypothetical protein
METAEAVIHVRYRMGMVPTLPNAALSALRNVAAAADHGPVLRNRQPRSAYAGGTKKRVTGVGP